MGSKRNPAATVAHHSPGAVARARPAVVDEVFGLK